MRTLIFTCGYEDCYFQFANWFAHTVRHYGYEGDLIIFSTQDRESPHAEVINVATHPDAQLLRTPQGRYYNSRIPRQFGYEYYKKPWDFFMIKTLPGTFIDRDQYDFILYCDSDILARKSFNPIFHHQTVVVGYNAWPVYRNLKRLVGLLQPEEVEAAKRLPGSGGGVVGVPRSMYDFYETYRQTYLETLRQTPHDQPALSLTLFRHRDRFKPVQLERSYLDHYWGQAGRKMRMHKAYQDFPRETKQEPSAIMEPPPADSVSKVLMTATGEQRRIT